jgi:hypothetical protein
MNRNQNLDEVVFEVVFVGWNVMLMLFQHKYISRFELINKLAMQIMLINLIHPSNYPNLSYLKFCFLSSLIFSYLFDILRISIIIFDKQVRIFTGQAVH